MQRFFIEKSEDELYISHSGLALVGCASTTFTKHLVIMRFAGAISNQKKNSLVKEQGYSESCRRIFKINQTVVSNFPNFE